SGRALEGATRGVMEERLGADFRNVRLHIDARAADAAARMSARAFTFGQHIGFAAQQYSPETRAGRSLLAHELGHVIQQGSADPSRTARFELGTADGPLEMEARAVAQRASEVGTRANPRVPTHVLRRSATGGMGVVLREPAAGATAQDVTD